ncbi:tail fiber domain-containing protein [Hymenobacter sp. ASUV-10]|uniref:Tail fiber domain-containing protein n=1 Tax=Hymenobacter aranciens TaxID=3063996 RepID=A0ABT9B5G9_9BACT|nr:tail fiber domain-containing protein [Hymenobacter sp. ASUV-10]MDO7873516.1 tail fiber domain-containing protein [Hymenobacter sp. ASUV-10]
MHTSIRSRRALLLALFATATGAARAQNVGVGTLTPSEKLDVVGGNLKLTTAGSRLIFPDGTFQTTAASGTGTGSFILNAPVSQQTGSFNLSGAGTLGGTLTTGGTVAVDNADGNTGTAANFLRFGSSGSGEGIGSKRNAGGNAYALDFYTSFTNRMTITNTGRVGIGITNPGQALEVNGNVLVNLAYDLLLRDTNHGLGFYNSAKPWNGLDVNGPALYGYAGGVLGTNQGGTRTTALYWNSTGQVGIGTSSPAARLTVQNATDADRGVQVSDGSNGNIVLQPLTGANSGYAFLGFNGYNNNGEVRVNTNKNRWRVGVDQRGSTDNFFIDTYNGTTGASALTVTTAGNVGIGTTNPGTRLDVVGSGGNAVNLRVNGRLQTGDGTNQGGVWLNSATTQFVGQFDATKIGVFNGGAWRMVVDDAGKVGIGTTGPSFPLDVQTTATTGAYSFGYLNPSGQTGSGSIGANGVGISIRATGRILSSEFNAVSDRRLKTVVGLSDRTADLALLNRLRITDYTMRDRVQFGNRAFKKVIAQEVEAVFPQAVQQQTGFLPDIYALATTVQALPGDSLVTLTLPTAGLPVAAAVGQRLKLVGDTGEVLAALARPAAAGARTLVLRRATALAGTKVFVFGLEHADVRSVDYEALSMLNVSATQELARKVELLEKQNAALQAGSAADHASLLTLQAQMARLLGEGAQARK